MLSFSGHQGSWTVMLFTFKNSVPLMNALGVVSEVASFISTDKQPQ